jgi:hypothetical protein
MTKSVIALASLLALAPITSCTDSLESPEVDDSDPGVVESDPQALADPTPAATCTVSGTDVNRSLVVTTPSILAKLSFSRVMGQLRSTAGVATVQTNRDLFQSWMRTFGATAATGDCNDASIDPNDYGLVCPRPEAKLATLDPFVASSNVSFNPVGLFNRFDLAPANGSNCGEYRIVYAMTESNATVSGRAFLIFEATLPNPTPSAGKVGCLPVAKFWQSLTSDASEASRAAKLERFYITGGAIAGFPPVVRAQHYGLANGATAAFGAGQVRTNFFVDNQQWHLREFKLRKACSVATDPATCRLRFDHVTVKANPADELFAGTHARSAAFRGTLPGLVRTLRATTISGIGMATGDQFNTFESISQPGADGAVLYSGLANAAARTAIQTELTALGSTLTVNNILDRATTQTCAGCHQSSNGRALGGGLTWPSSAFFVHITESRSLSQALVSQFLPRRRAVLEQFINASCAPTAAAVEVIDDGLTIGGSPVGAHN